MEAVGSEPPVDLGRAVRDALAVYYFPGMWEWDRSIVRALAYQGFRRSVGEGAPGLVLLERYFDWAAVVDDFVPIRVETDVEATVPDPRVPDRDLATADGSPVRYVARLDLLAVDEHDNYWVFDHRLVSGGWTEPDLLLLEEHATSLCWAWELAFLGMEVAGVVYNEIRRDAEGAVTPPGPAQASAAGAGGHRRLYAQASQAPGAVVVQELEGSFRRTWVPRSAAQLAALRARVGHEAVEMVDPEVAIYPNPAPSNCGPCEYRAPCLAVTLGSDVSSVLASGYRRKAPEQLVEGRLGGVTWAMGRGAAPPRFRSDRRER